MANTIKIKRGSGSDPAASDMVLGEPVLRTDTAELFFKKDDGSVAKVSGGGGGPDFKYLELRNAANNGAASYPANDFTLVTSGTTNAITPAAANTLLVSVNGVIQKPNAGTSTSGITGFIVDGSRFKTATNLTQAPDFILYQESGGIGEPSDNTVSEAKLKVSNSPVNGYFLSAQSGNTGGLTWAAPIATSCTGNSATATALATARAINGVNFDGTAAITVTAAAGTLSGTTLNSSVVTSSLTSLGDLSGLTVNGDMALTGANYNVLWDKSDNALEFADNAKAKFGAGDDLQIYHDPASGGSSFIDVTGVLQIHTSQLYINNEANTERLLRCTQNDSVELYYDGSKKFETTSGGASITGNLSFGDNHYAMFGAGNDLQIYHSGTDTFFKNQTGSLNFFNSGVTQFRNAADNETLLKMTSDGSVELYHDGSKKFETTSNGVKLGDSTQLTIGDGNDFRLEHDGSNSYVTNYTGDLIFRTDGNEISAKFKPNAAVELYHNNVNRLATSTTGIRVESRIAGMSDDNTYVNIGTGSNDQFQFYTGGIDRLFITGSPSDSGTVQIRGDNTRLQIGASQDLELFHNGSNSYIQDNGTGGLYIGSNGGNVYIRGQHGEESIIANSNGSVDLYYDNSKKFETISTGSKISGRLGVGINPNRALHVSQASGLGTVGVGAFENGDESNNSAVVFMSTVRNGNAGESFLQCNRDQNNNGQGVAATVFIRTNGDFDSATNSYGGISDITLKENIVDAKSQWDDIKNIKVRNFNFKDNPNQKMLGVVAQEIETVCSGLVKETSDEGTTLKTVKYSILYMKAIKGLQEAMARIEVLEAKVTALEAK